MHRTETGDDDAPHLISHVVTTSAPAADGDVTSQVHAALRGKGLLPDKHLADTACVDAELLVASREEFGVDLIGPTRPDDRRQARGVGFAAGDFVVDWDQRQATCPAGKCSSSWTPAVDRGHNAVIQIKFAKRDCQARPSRADCTPAARRTITVGPEDQYVALQTARAREATGEFRVEYARRAGIEGTISQGGVRAFGLRRSRYAGAAKTHLEHMATAAAINMVRIGSWLSDESREQTRTSAFAKLMALSLAA